MSKITFAAGTVTGGVDCVKLLADEGMFDSPIKIVFSCVFIIVVAVCGGLTALLIQDGIKKWANKQKSKEWMEKP